MKKRIPIIINEKDIKLIVITDYKAFIILEKDPDDDKRYITTYRYNRRILSKEDHYCDICGSIWKDDQSDDIHHCAESERKIYSYNEIIDLVYDHLEDELTVYINTFNGDNHRFKL